MRRTARYVAATQVDYAFAPDAGSAAERQHQPMEKWEYKTFDLLKRKDEADQLNRLGQDGWEAVGMISSWGVGWRMVHPIVLFKRPLSTAP